MPPAFYQNIVRYLINPFVDIIYPPLCHHCDALLPTDHKIICQSCLKEIAKFNGELDKALAGRSFNNIFILFEYGSVVRELIHLLKYKKYLSLCNFLANEAGVRFPSLIDSDYTAVVPVPLYKTKQRERGFNQSGEIARAIAQQFNLVLKNELLLRLRYTASQTKKSRMEREENMRDAFTCPFPLKNEKILLVDDVITTGSTIEACLRPLRDAGASLVDVLAIAHPHETG